MAGGLPHTKICNEVIILLKSASW